MSLELQVSMDWALLVVLQVMLQPSLSVLFTVEAERSLYESEFGGVVVMGCRFQPKLSNPPVNLKVTWHWGVREVYRMDNGKEHLATQDPEYRGRVTLLTEELKEGWAKLQVSGLRINDSGLYQCLVQTEEGADYKAITLSVKAPYKAVTKRIQKAAEGDEVLLTCESEGYPQSSVTWQDGHNSGPLQSLNPNTTTVSTPDQLFKVTSQLHVRSSDKNNYTCSFTEGGYSATFHIPDEMPIPGVKSDALIIVLIIGLIIVVTVAVVMYRRRKGFCKPTTRNLLVEDGCRPIPAATCIHISKENEEERTIFKQGCTEETLGAFVKAHYSDLVCSSDTRRHWDAFGEEELPQRLQNNKGQPVNLQALLPEAGETLLLEGPPVSGKTTVAHILLSAWTEGPSTVLDLSTLRLFVYVDCGKVKGDLFQEITTQLPLKKNMLWTEEELRTVLSGSSEALLLLDGYREEGSPVFDESLRRFLRERRGECRVLVMACPGHCPALKDTVGTAGMLELRTQTVKY